MDYGKPFLSYDVGKRYEWLLGNGLGGYASSTIIGANTRKYHGLLVAAIEGRRWLLLPKVEERVITSGGSYDLSTNLYPGAVHPHGYANQTLFRFRYVPAFHYALEEAFIEKRVAPVHGRNAVVVSYRIFNAGEPFELRVRPFVNCRDIHSNLHSDAVSWGFRGKAEEKVLTIRANFEGAPSLIVGSDRGVYGGEDFWIKEMVYEEEGARGYDDREDHFSPGEFMFTVGRGTEELHVLAVGGDPKGEVFDPLYKNLKNLTKLEIERRKALLPKEKHPDPIQALLLAADAFLIDGPQGAGIVAGYPWFSEWGRDAMIALPGLTLATGRFEVARAILKRYASHARRGLLPNLFVDGSVAEYNSVDASLWFLQAVGKYLWYSQDYAFVKKELWPTVQEIIGAYRDGTDYNIHMDKDGLVSAGAQLTWMDAKIGDQVVTPREGKAVEVNALWYSGLRLAAELAVKFGERDAYGGLAARAREGFQAFWNENEKCLYDVLGMKPDPSVRPNQLLALSLGPLLPREREEMVLRKVWRELLTPYGLRSLSPRDPRYRGRYEGDQRQRDLAYHQGTVWSWLMGPFITAYLRLHPEGRDTVERHVLSPFLSHLREGGVGYISEIFDGDGPHQARGCMAQAWSVGEILRAYFEDIKGTRR